MSEIKDVTELMHNFHNQGRAIEKLYDLREKISDIIEGEQNTCDDFQCLRLDINLIIQMLEYKW